MRVVVTGSSGHLGEALVRTLREQEQVSGIDLVPSPWTDVVASVADRERVREVVRGADVVLHTATLHKPHLATHSRGQFVASNVTGTLVLLEEAVAAGVQCFVYTSSTSVFGRALTPPDGDPAAWITEDVPPVPRNIYGVTKKAAEELCELAAYESGLRCVVLRTSRFFPEDDDRADVRDGYDGDNAKVNELLHRRVDIADAVAAHLHAVQPVRERPFARYIVTATTPFEPADAAELRRDAPAALARRVPAHREIYDARGWRMFPHIDRVYVNNLARQELGWTPDYTFAHALDLLRTGRDWRSPLAAAVGAKGY